MSFNLDEKNNYKVDDRGLEASGLLFLWLMWIWWQSVFIDSENVDRLQVIVNVDNMIYLAISSELHIESLLIVNLKNI